MAASEKMLGVLLPGFVLVDGDGAGAADRIGPRASAEVKVDVGGLVRVQALKSRST